MIWAAAPFLLSCAENKPEPGGRDDRSFDPPRFRQRGGRGGRRRGARDRAARGAARAAASDNKTLRFIAQSDLRVLDPVWTTAYITRNHAYCVFDQLFAIDAEFAPQPQMVGEHQISADKLTYNFKLRDGLAFHDGSPVKGTDCVASIKRWMARDGHGQAMKPVL